MVKQLRRLHALGARTILVTNLMPIGCLPIADILPDLNGGCNEVVNRVPALHNHALESSLALLGGLPGARFVTVDINAAFRDVLADRAAFGGYNFTDMSGACCASLGSEYLCGQKVLGVKAYDVCSDPTRTFFWDSVHLTDVGYHTVVHKFVFGTNFTRPGPNLRSL
eukprot:jgi/Mesen1/4540/ME000232S03797